MNGNHELAKMALQHVIDKQRERIQELEKSMRVVKSLADGLTDTIVGHDADDLLFELKQETEKYV